MGQICSLCGTDPYYVSIAMKQPHGTMCGWMDTNLRQNELREDHIQTWIHMVCSRHTWNHQILYNDEEPDNIPEHSFPKRKGHTKGIVLWNSRTIGWLVHSVPKYPETIRLESPFMIPNISEPQLIYGQSFCYVEMNMSHYDNIISAIQNMESSIYYTTLPSETFLKRTLKENQVIEFELYPNVFHVSKSSVWDKELYQDYLAVRMNGPILVQTWMKNGLPSTPQVKNIKMMKLGEHEEYKTSQDHSKFAISMNCRHPWLFIGDINRMDSQFKRGGGGMLIEDKKLWQAVHRMVQNYTEDIENPNRSPGSLCF